MEPWEQTKLELLEKLQTLTEENRRLQVFKDAILQVGVSRWKTPWIQTKTKELKPSLTD